MAIKCPKCQSENPDTKQFCGDCGTQLTPVEGAQPSFTKTLETPVEELARGTTLAGRYEVIETLGTGGMGHVYKAYDNQLKEEVALKLIKPEIASSRKTLNRFSNELKIARKIVHKNIGRMYELMEDEGTFFITMEYVPGQDLKGLIRQSRQLTSGTAISITKQICDGLSEAHKLGVIHRDLKPSNIMIDKEGDVRIMDFGIARSLTTKGITGAGVIIGTPEYMSPEQVEGKDIDQRSDIYSLGVILYEMVTGQLPFEGDTPLSIAMKHKGEIPKDPKALNPQIQEDLNSLILNCLEKDKEKRYQSGEELHSDLDAIERGIPTAEKVAPKKKPLTSKEITVQFTLKKALFPLIGAVALVIIVIFIWRPWSKEQAPLPQTGKPTLAIVYFENNTGDENLEYLRSGLSEWLITDLSQSKYINVLSGDRIYGILQSLDLLDSEKYSTDDLKKVASESGATHILKGSYIRISENFVITTMLQEAQSGNVISSKKAECKGEAEILTQIDRLTREIKADLNLSQEQIENDFDRLVSHITTSSPQALKFYVEGYHYHLREEFQNAIQSFEKAVAIDPDFATAYRKMAVEYSNLGFSARAHEYYKKAFELRDRGSDRERYLIEADYYRQSWKTYDKAINSYEKLIELYPDDSSGSNNLGVLYGTIEDNDKALEKFHEALTIRKLDKLPAPNSAGNLAYLYIVKGLYDKAEEVLQYHLENFPDNVYIRSQMALNYLAQKEFDQALLHVDRAYSMNPKYSRAILAKGDTYFCMEDFVNAELSYQQLLQLEEPIQHLTGMRRLIALNLASGKFDHAMGYAKRGVQLSEELEERRYEARFHIHLANTYLQSGQPEKAQDECEKAVEPAIEEDSYTLQRDILHFKGLIYIAINSLPEAEKIAEELKTLVDSSMNKKGMRFYYHLMGQIELFKGDITNAIKHWEEAVSLLPYHQCVDQYAFILKPLADVYFRSGNNDKAEELYKEITSIVLDRVFMGESYAKAFYMLGKIHEQQGDHTKAIEHYEKFLDLWKDADPGIAEVEDAKKRLAGLKQN